MSVTLWADVPQEYRFVTRDERRNGCTYMGLRDAGRCTAAVPFEGGTYYRRCDAPVKTEALCYVHAVSAGMIATKTPAELLLARAIQCVRRNYFPEPRLKAFRAMSDDDIFEMRNVGTKTAALICEMRDTWTDEQLCEAFGWPRARQPKALPEQIDAFFATRPDVFAVIGG